MAKKLILLSVVGVVLLALAGTSVISSKAHVPLNKVQICTSTGEVRNITQRNLQKRLADNACRLTACAFNDVDDNGDLVQQFIFLPGNDCDSTDANGDGFCDATGSPKSVPKRLRANNVTPACTNSY